MSVDREMGLRLKLILGFAATPMIMVALNVIGIFRVSAIDQGLTTINDVNSVKQRYAINFRGSVHDRAISLRDVVLYTDSASVQHSIDEIKKLAEFYEKSAGPLDQLVADPSTASEEKELLQTIKRIEKTTLPLVDQVIQAKLRDENDLAWRLLMKEAKPAFSEWLASINKFIDFQENLNTLQSKKAREIASGFTYLMVLLTLACVFVSGIMGFFIIRSITRPLSQVRTDLRLSGAQVTKASENLNSASQQMSSESAESAASLEESVASMHELASMVKLNADNAQSASALSKKGRDQAERGMQQMQKLMVSINDIRQGSRKVGEIINVIDDIAFQTNLLALKAAVEAARAGEQGKGFAVVADAVRNLAQKSASSAKEISDLIKVSTEQVDEGVVLAEGSGTVLQELAESIKKISDLNNEIATGSVEQSKGIEQITAALNQLDRGVQGNALTSQGVATSAGELSVQAARMENAVDRLSMLVDGRMHESANSSEAHRHADFPGDEHDENGKLIPKAA